MLAAVPGPGGGGVNRGVSSCRALSVSRSFGAHEVLNATAATAKHSTANARPIADSTLICSLYADSTTLSFKPKKCTSAQQLPDGVGPGHRFRHSRPGVAHASGKIAIVDQHAHRG